MSALTVALLVSVFGCYAMGSKNFALHKPASQSSTFVDGGGDRSAGAAVNGVLTDYTKTDNSPPLWWKVDLEILTKISQVKIYNRIDCCQQDLQQISILVSNQSKPSDPSFKLDDWDRLSFRVPAYGEIGIEDVRPAVMARHVAILSGYFPPLAMAEVEVYGVENLASSKPAYQNAGQVTPAGVAVNGDFSDYTNIIYNGTKWWRVDLGDKYSINKIEISTGTLTHDTLSQITVMTSNAVTPTNLSVSYEGWTNRSYQGPAYGAVGVIDFTSPIEAQHVAVVSENIAAPLSLAEVVVYEHDYARKKPASQSSTYGKHNASRAVDGDLNKFSHTTLVHNNADLWWMVDIGVEIQLKKVEVYMRNGKCTTSGKSQDCFLRLTDAYFLTNKNEAAIKPNIEGHGEWSICYHSPRPLGIHLKVKCDQNELNPVTRIFSIVAQNSYSIELREVELYGRELKERTEILNWRITKRSYSVVGISFTRINQSRLGSAPPTSYTVVIEGKSNQTIKFPNNSDKIETVWSGLQPQSDYTFIVVCMVEGVLCVGPQEKFNISTIPCSAPGNIHLNVECRGVFQNFKRKWFCEATFKTLQPNCYGELTYIYSVLDVVNQSTYSQNIIFHVDEDQEYNLSVWAVNSLGFSSYSSVSGKIVQESNLSAGFGGLAAGIVLGILVCFLIHKIKHQPNRCATRARRSGDAVSQQNDYADSADHSSKREYVSIESALHAIVEASRNDNNITADEQDCKVECKRYKNPANEPLVGARRRTTNEYESVEYGANDSDDESDDGYEVPIN